MRLRQKGEAFGHSLTDLMTSIAVIFILLFLVFVRNEQQEMAVQKKETASNRDLLLTELQRQFGGEDVKIESDPEDPLTVLVVLTDNRELLGFEFNQAMVREKGISFLRNFAPQLMGIICAEHRAAAMDSVIIEGHTDSEGTDDVNTELSAKRATAVLVQSRLILEQHDRSVQRGEPLLQPCFLRLAQATGRGEQELIRVGATGLEDPAASRRVVVKVRVKSLEQRQAISTAMPAAEELPHG